MQRLLNSLPLLVRSTIVDSILKGGPLQVPCDVAMEELRLSFINKLGFSEEQIIDWFPTPNHLPPVDLVLLSKNQHGTRVVQCLIENASERDFISFKDFIVKSPTFLSDLALDPHGCHVVLRLMEAPNVPTAKLVIAQIMAAFNMLACGKFSVLCLQRAFDLAEPCERTLLLNETATFNVQLACDPIGNFFVSHLIKSSKQEEELCLVIGSLCGSAFVLALSKFASNVLELAIGPKFYLTIPTGPFSRVEYVSLMLVEELAGMRVTSPAGNVTESSIIPSTLPLINPTILYHLMIDPIGNYTWQKALMFTSEVFSFSSPRHAAISHTLRSIYTYLTPYISPTLPHSRWLIAKLKLYLPHLLALLSTPLGTKTTRNDSTLRQQHRLPSMEGGVARSTPRRPSGR